MDEVATSAAEIGIAFQKVGGTAGSLNVEFEKVVSWIATISARTRESATTIGNSTKTILARFQQLREEGFTELEDDGITEVSQVAKALATVGIRLLDEQTQQFRNIGDVMDEVGAKWNTLTKNEKAYLGTVLAGTRQQARFLALMEGYDDALALYNNSLNAAGTTQSKFIIQQQSMEAHTNRLKASIESLQLSLIDSTFLKGLVDMGTAVVTLVEKFNLVGVAVSILATVAFAKLDIAFRLSLANAIGFRASVVALGTSLKGLIATIGLANIAFGAFVFVAGLVVSSIIKQKEEAKLAAAQQEEFNQKLETFNKLLDEFEDGATNIESVAQAFQNLNTSANLDELIADLQSVNKEVTRLRQTAQGGNIDLGTGITAGFDVQLEVQTKRQEDLNEAIDKNLKLMQRMRDARQREADDAKLVADSLDKLIAGEEIDEEIKLRLLDLYPSLNDEIINQSDYLSDLRDQYKNFTQEELTNSQNRINARINESEANIELAKSQLQIVQAQILAGQLDPGTGRFAGAAITDAIRTYMQQLEDLQVELNVVNALTEKSLRPAKKVDLDEQYEPLKNIIRDIAHEAELLGFQLEKAVGEDKIPIIMKLNEVYRKQQDALHNLAEAYRAEQEGLNESSDRYQELKGNIQELQVQWWQLNSAQLANIKTMQEVSKETEELNRETLESIANIEKQIVELYERQKDEKLDIIKEQYDEELEELEEKYQKQKELHQEDLDDFRKTQQAKIDAIRATEDEEAFESELEQLQKERSELQARYNELLLASGRAEAVQREEILNEIAEKEQEINELVADRNRELQIDNLEDTIDDFEDYINDKQSALDSDYANDKARIERLYNEQVDALEREFSKEKLYSKARVALHSGEYDELLELFDNYQKETGEGFSSLGDIIRNEFVKALKDAADALEELNDLGIDIDLDLEKPTDDKPSKIPGTGYVHPGTKEEEIIAISNRQGVDLATARDMYDKNVELGFQKYIGGGVDSTGGLKELHGTKNKSEVIFNSGQAKDLFNAVVNNLPQMNAISDSIISRADGIIPQTNGGGDTNISFDNLLTINADKIDNSSIPNIEKIIQKQFGEFQRLANKGRFSANKRQVVI